MKPAGDTTGDHRRNPWLFVTSAISRFLRIQVAVSVHDHVSGFHIPSTFTSTGLRNR